MTWWLQQAEKPQEIAPAGPDLPVATFGEGLTAAYLSANRASNVFNEFESRVAEDEADTGDEVVKRLGLPGIMDGLRQKGVITPSMEHYGWDFLRYNTDVRRAVLDLGVAASEMDPEAWKGVDLTTEGAEARVTEAQKKEAQDQAEILAMSPYPIAESIVGSLGSAVTDPRQWPLMLFNPGGSFLKVVGWQAALGVAGEAVTLPGQQVTAERLGEPAPNIAAQLALAAAGGAILGGALEGAFRLPGIVRGLRLHAERVRPPEGAFNPKVEPAIAAAEDAIVLDAPLQPAIESVMPPADDAMPDFETQWREIDAATNWERVFEDAAPPEAQAAAPTWQEGLAEAEKVLADIARERKALGRPLTNFVREKTGGIHPDSQVAEELRAAGITAKSLPGLFTRKASKNLDNLLANEADAAMPGLARVVGGDGTGNYLSQQGVIDNLVNELTGKRLPTDREAELMAMEADAARAVETARIEADIDDAAGKVVLTARERDYVRAAIAEGRPADDAVYEAIARQFDDFEGQEVPSHVYEREAEWEPFRDEGAYREASGSGAAGDGGSVGPEQDGSASGAGAAGSGPDFSVEATPAGQQTLIPGTEVRARDTSRDRALADLQAKQSKMRRLDQLPPEGMFAPKQMSAFDDPASPQAAAFVDARVAEMRAEIDPENPVAVSVMAEDGRVLTTTEAVVQEIDELDQMEREFTACLTGGVNVSA